MRLVFAMGKFLAVGVAVSVLVAWAIAASHSRKGEPSAYHNPRGGEDPVVFLAIRSARFEYVTGMGRPGTRLSRFPETVKPFDGAVWWPRDAVTFDDGRYAITSGWPLPCVYAWHHGEWRDDETWRSVYHGGIVLTRGERSSGDLVLPWWPRWTGLAIDAVLWAIISGLAFHAPAIAKRWRRRRKGHCGHCGYPRSGEVCPECGSVMR